MRFQIPVTGEILNRVARIDHFRGVWGSGGLIPADRREAIKAAVRQHSTLSASRLAGIRVTEEDVRAILAGEPSGLPEAREVRGYAAALQAPPAPTDALLDGEGIRRVHAGIMTGEPYSEATPWRETPADPEAFDGEGRALGRVFMTLPPRLVPQTMEDLTTWVELELREREHHPLLVCGTFMLGMLAANPFVRGNLRVSMVLTIRMLEHVGYGYMPYGSLESALESTRERFYEAFDVSQTRIWTGEADLQPWLTYLMDALDQHAGEVSALVSSEREATEFSPLQRAIVEIVRRHGTAEAGLLISTTGANRNTLKDNLRRLVERGVLEKMGARRGTRYRISRAQAARLPGRDV